MPSSSARKYRRKVDRLMNRKDCKCNYLMIECGWKWYCTKCGRIENKTDIKSRFTIWMLRLLWGKE